MGRVLLAGYLGCGNFGDDAILAGFVEVAQSMGVECSALSGNPEETNRLTRIPAYGRRDNGQIEQALDRADMLVFPGGSIFQDSTSVGSVYYYSQLVAKAKKAGKRVVMVGQGVGPLKTYFGKRWAKAAFNDCDAIAVRDPASLATLKELGVTVPITVTADNAFLLNASPLSGDDASSFGVGKMRTIAVAPRPLPGKIDVVGLIGEFCRMVFQSGSMPTLLPMDRNEDLPLIQAISDRQGGKIPDLKKIDSPIEIQRRLARMDGVVAMRLHAGILGANAGAPPLMLNYDPKVAAFARQLDLGSAIALDGLTPARLFDTYPAVMKDRDRNVKILERKRAELAQLAIQNVEIVRDLLNRGS